MTAEVGEGKFGTLRGDLSFSKDKIDFLLTRFPKLYLAVERRREWVNWDKRVYLSFVGGGNVVLDVGANVGAHTVFLSHLVGPRGKVVAFEPLTGNLESLEKLIARRGRFRNVEIVRAAVGNPDTSTSSATLRVPGSDFTQASLAVQSAGSWSAETEVRTFECPITSLDRDPAVQKLSAINFIKLDVEGAELSALEGGAATISQHRPLIYCEIYRKWTEPFGYGPAELMAFLRSLGYGEARLIIDGEIRAHELGDPLAADWFARSSDGLFFLNEHREMVRRFDDRYLSNRE